MMIVGACKTLPLVVSTLITQDVSLCLRITSRSCRAGKLDASQAVIFFIYVVVTVLYST